MSDLSIETYDDIGVQRIIYDATNVSWSSHYGNEGSGFGYFRFKLAREIGHDYKDIGFGYLLKARLYLNTFVHVGQIRSIDEKSGPNGDEISVTALGHLVVADDDEILRHYCDTRLPMWHVDSEVPKGSFRPDLYTTGRNTLGLYLHASNGKDLTAADYTEMEYEFPSDESAERFKADVSLVLGSGIAFDGQVDSIDLGNGYVFYKTDSGEGNIAVGMILYNYTQDKSATVSAIDTGLNRITVDTPSAIGGWAVNDEIYVTGPLFHAQISVIAAAVITYANDIGEGNLANGQTLVNLTKKAVATIQAFNAGANTITVTAEAHITGWEVDDVIMVAAAYFSAVYTGKVGATVSYSSPVGERIASNATGWVLYNVDEDEFATVASWNIGANELDVTAAGDLTVNWTNGDVIHIYTPFRLKILDTDDTLLWPASDWRQGAVLHDRTAVNVTTAGNPSKLKIRWEAYISGSSDETSFAALTSVKAYSTTSAVDATMLATDIVSILSAAGHDLSSSTDEIASITKTLEPMVFEYETPAKALAWACKYGDSSSNRLAWGVRLNDSLELFLEVQDEATIKYVVKRTGPVEASVSGDLQQSWQQVRGIYADKMGEQQRTAWQSDADEYFAGHYRRKSVQLESIDTDAEAIVAITMFLDDNKKPKTSARYRAGPGSVFTANDLSVPIEEVRATGGIVMIEDWRAVETGISGTDIRDSWTKEQIAIVEINYDSGTATLTPASAQKDFESYMAELSRLARVQ